MNNSISDDRVAIRDIVERFSMGATMRDSAAIAALFLDDGIWDTGAPYNIVIQGADRIAETITSSMKAFEYAIQMIHGTIIDVDGGRAKARSILEEICRKPGGDGGVRIHGIYIDDLVRTAAGWRFEKRSFNAISYDRSPINGEPPRAAVA